MLAAWANRVSAAASVTKSACRAWIAARAMLRLMVIDSSPARPLVRVVLGVIVAAVSSHRQMNPRCTGRLSSASFTTLPSISSRSTLESSTSPTCLNRSMIETRVRCGRPRGCPRSKVPMPPPSVCS